MWVDSRNLTVGGAAFLPSRSAPTYIPRIPRRAGRDARHPHPRRHGMKRTALFALGAALLAAPVGAQEWTTSDPVLRAIWEEATQRSQLEPLAQALLDSLGPRLTGSPEQAAAQNWLIEQYGRWGIQARNEQYGTWRGWRRGYTHVDLLSPRVRTLEAMMLAWSPGTTAPVE